MSALIELVESNEGASITSLFSQYRESVMDRLGHDYSADNALTMLFNDIDETMFKLDKEQKDEEVMRARLKEIQDTIVSQGGPSRVTMLMLEQTVGKEYINPLMPVNAYTERPEAEYMHYAMENMNSVMKAVAGFATQGYARFIVIAFLAIIAILRFLIGTMDSDGGDGGGSGGGGSPLPQGNPSKPAPRIPDAPVAPKPDAAQPTPEDISNMTLGEIVNNLPGKNFREAYEKLSTAVDNYKNFGTWYPDLNGLSANETYNKLEGIITAMSDDLSSVFGKNGKMTELVAQLELTYMAALEESRAKHLGDFWLSVAKGTNDNFKYTENGSVLSNNAFANYIDTMTYIKGALPNVFKVISTNLGGEKVAIPDDSPVHDLAKLDGANGPYPRQLDSVNNAPVKNFMAPLNDKSIIDGKNYSASIKLGSIAKLPNMSKIVESLEKVTTDIENTYKSVKKEDDKLDKAYLKFEQMGKDRGAELSAAAKNFIGSDMFAVKDALRLNLKMTMAIMRTFSAEIKSLKTIIDAIAAIANDSQQ